MTTTKVRDTEVGLSQDGATNPIVGLYAFGAGLCALGFLLLPASDVKLALLLFFSLTGPGAAIAAHLKLRQNWVILAVTLTGSLSISAVVPTVMIWMRWWQPVWALAGLAVGTAITAGIAIAKALPSGQVFRLRTPAAPTDGERLSLKVPSGIAARLMSVVRPYPALLLLSLAIVGWVYSLITADPLNASRFGLTATLGPVFVVAVILTATAFAVELSSNARPVVLGVIAFFFVMLLRGSVPLIVSTPEYAWTYKHFGVVDLLNAAGQIVNERDIFQQWPAFFAYFAQYSHVAGVDPGSVAAWSSLVFCLIDGILVYALAKTIKANTRIAFLTVFIFEAAFWPDTNYFSPQAFAYALSLGFLFILLRWFVQPPALNAGSRNFLARRLARYDLAIGSGFQSLSIGARIGASVALAGVFFVITAAHQLSPYIMLLAVGSLMVCSLIRPRWMIVLLAAIALGYFLPRFADVTSQFKILDALNIFANASGNGLHVDPSSAQLVSTLAARVLTFVLWGSAALVIAIAFFRKMLGKYTIPIMLAFSPFGILLAGNYGGEAIYRVIIFSLPWFAYLIADGLGQLTASRLRYAATWSVALSAAALLALQGGAQGQFVFNVMSAGEVQASRYFYQNAPDGSSLTLAAQVFPTRLSAEYNHVNPTLTTDPALLDSEVLVNRTWDSSVLPEIKQQVSQWPGSAHFLVVSDRMKSYVSYFGLLDPSSIDSVQDALAQSSDWSVWYSDGDTTIYQLNASP